MSERKSPKWSKFPTASDVEKFDGLHCQKLYRETVRTGWRCPSYRRSAVELIRWSEIRGPSWRATHGDKFGMGFTISFARHHCHGEGRFPETLICGDCNSADGAAKRKLRLPKTWTYSPAELARFVMAVPHSGRVKIDYDVALAIYSDARKPAF